MTDETANQTVAAPKKKRGWPAGKPRGPRREAVAQAEPVRPPIRATAQMRAKPNWVDMTDEQSGVDRFHIPQSLVPEGFSLQFVTDSTYGRPEPQHRATFEKGGWTPVHAEDFGGRFDGMFMPKGYDGEINVGGQVLMARPKEITDRAIEREKRAAREPMEIKQQQVSGNIPGVTLDTGHESALRTNKINRSYERIEIPDK